jgi:hypothetical protein
LFPYVKNNAIVVMQGIVMVAPADVELSLDNKG